MLLLPNEVKPLLLLQLITLHLHLLWQLPTLQHVVSSGKQSLLSSRKTDYVRSVNTSFDTTALQSPCCWTFLRDLRSLGGLNCHILVSLEWSWLLGLFTRILLDSFMFPFIPSSPVQLQEEVLVLVERGYPKDTFLVVCAIWRSSIYLDVQVMGRCGIDTIL